MTLPTFPEFVCTIVRNALVERDEDGTERVVGSVVVGECMIRDRKARARVGIERAIELAARNDNDLEVLARPGLRLAFEELYETYSGLRLPPRH